MISGRHPTGADRPGADPPGKLPPGGTFPGGTAPGGTAPGGTAPGGTAPGGTAPGGTAPGGTAPGGTGPGGAAPSRHVVTLLSRPGCHLCDDAREVIARVTAELGVRWEERDITASEEDLREYWDKIPVTLIDGVGHDFWRVSEDRLRAALAR